MAYRRTQAVVKRLAARRGAILSAARAAAVESGLGAVQIAPIADRANIAAGTLYRYFPSKTELVAELITEFSDTLLEAVRRAANAAPGPLSALAGAIATVAAQIAAQRKLAWGILAEPIDQDLAPSRIASRRMIVGELEARIEAAMRGSHLPSQDAALTAAAILGALNEGLVGPLAPEALDDPVKMHAAVQSLTLMALRAAGVMDARARGLVVQAGVAGPAKATIPAG